MIFICLTPLFSTLTVSLNKAERSLIEFQTHRSTKRTEEDSAINVIRLLFSKYNELVAIPKREVSENTIY